MQLTIWYMRLGWSFGLDDLPAITSSGISLASDQLQLSDTETRVTCRLVIVSILKKNIMSQIKQASAPGLHLFHIVDCLKLAMKANMHMQTAINSPRRIVNYYNRTFSIYRTLRNGYIGDISYDANSR